MKKLATFFVAFGLILGISKAQPVSDMGVIPIGVTLNSILRLNIISGGNIEFVVTTIDQYSSGILNSSQYDTRFTVASSQDFNVTMQAETADLFNSGGVGGVVGMPLNNIGYRVSEAGTYAETTNWVILSNAATLPLTFAVATIINGVAGASAGSALNNDFTINWELGTRAGTMNALTLLEQSLAADRYSVNVLMQLVAK